MNWEQYIPVDPYLIGLLVAAVLGFWLVRYIRTKRRNNIVIGANVGAIQKTLGEDFLTIADNLGAIEKCPEPGCKGTLYEASPNVKRCTLCERFVFSKTGYQRVKEQIKIGQK